MREPTALDNPDQPLPAMSQVDVFADTEEVRAADFPNVPAELLAAILTAERDNPEDRPTAARAVGRIIDAYLAETAPGPGGKDTT